MSFYNEQTPPPPSETEVTASALGLPKVIWQDSLYRVVLWYNETDDEILRSPEHLTGSDLLGNERWELMGERTWDEARNEFVVSADWQYLAHQLAVTAAPWPDSTARGQAGEMPGSAARGQQIASFSADDIAAAESALLDAFYGVLSAYRTSDNNTVDQHLDVANAALQKLAETLGMDLSREPFRAPPSALQGDA